MTHQSTFDFLLAFTEYAYHLCCRNKEIPPTITDTIKSEANMGKIRNDLTGQRFGNFIVVGYSHCDEDHSFWNVLCDCGITKTVRTNHLKSGRSTSCGCGIKSGRPLGIEQPSDDLIRLIPLTKGAVSVVDSSDYAYVSQYKFCLLVTKQGKLYASGGPVGSLHRLLLPCPDGFEPDHIDRDGLNNRRSNLRVSTHSQNCANRGIRSDNTSGYKGVSWNKKLGKWQAQCSQYGKCYHLGFFKEKEDAAKAYRNKQVELYGPFAKW